MVGVAVVSVVDELRQEKGDEPVTSALVKGVAMEVGGRSLSE